MQDVELKEQISGGEAKTGLSEFFLALQSIYESLVASSSEPVRARIRAAVAENDREIERLLQEQRFSLQSPSEP